MSRYRKDPNAKRAEGRGAEVDDGLRSENRFCGRYFEPSLGTYKLVASESKGWREELSTRISLDMKDEMGRRLYAEDFSQAHSSPASGFSV